MGFTTRDEFEHFEFSEVHISEVSIHDNGFRIVLDDVIILPENSCNRDIRKMRCNGLNLSIHESVIESLVEEGYKTYNADGNLMSDEDDVEVEKDKYQEIFKLFEDAYAFEIKKEDNKYVFVIDGTNERTYCMTVTGSGDSESWEKFLNLE